MIDLIIMILATLGALFILIAAVGLVRMPDFYLRQSVTVKAATLGAGLIILAVSLYFHQLSVFTKAVAVIFFLFVTAPVSGHMICRSAYISGNKLWKDSVLDELQGKYDRETATLQGSDHVVAERKDTPDRRNSDSGKAADGGAGSQATD